MPTDIRLLVLGSGTSSGVPVIGCACPTCGSDDPRDHRLRTSAALQFRDPGGSLRTLLVDASPDLRQQALTHRLQRCDGILFTHNHVDHTFGLDEVRRFNVLMESPIEVHADERTMESLQQVFAHIFRRDRNVNASFVADLIPSIVLPDRLIERFGLRITPLPLLHGRLPVLGYRIEAADGRPRGPLPLAWCTDVSAIPPETWPRLRGLRTLVLDMLRYRRHPTHFTVDEAIGVAERIDAERTWFIHMTHDIRHAELDPRLPERMALAFDGLAITGPETIPAEGPEGLHEGL